MAAGIGNKDFYRLSGTLFYPEQTAFYSTTGRHRLQPEEQGPRPRAS